MPLGAILSTPIGEEKTMTETMFLSLVLFVFCGFGAVVAWVDYSTKDVRPPIAGPGPAE
jgi:hypothetical protein